MNRSNQLLVPSRLFWLLVIYAVLRLSGVSAPDGGWIAMGTMFYLCMTALR